jgi:hypothetical protein
LFSTAGSMVGGLFILYATVVYPVLGHILGHGYPRSPSFGIAVSLGEGRAELEEIEDSGEKQ